jgi:formylglycine-generating enzyme required for sulfatase activity
MTEVLDLRQKNKKAEHGIPEYRHFEQRELPLKKKNGWFKALAVVVTAVALTTVGIKASDNIFGAKNPQGEGSVCPVGMVFISSFEGGFCIDKYEASAGAGCSFKDPANQQETFKNIENPDCQAISDPGAIPWRNISQNQAALLCAKSGKRLPTNQEWLKAALGTPDKARDWNGEDCQVSNNWSAQPGATGSGKKCFSGSGAYDMVGNVWEWVNDTVTDGKIGDTILPGEGYVKGVDDKGLPSATDSELGDANYFYDYVWLKKTGTRGIARGGYWGNGAEAGQYSIYMVTEPSFAGVGVGFRCVK